MLHHNSHNQFDPKDIWQKDRDHFLHPWTHFDSFQKDGSFIVASGEGCHITDSDGKRYLDGISGMWCVNAGYGRTELADAMAEQARVLAYSNTFVDVTNAPVALLSARLAELAPGTLNHVAYATSGSCANDTALRLAHYYHGRRGETGRRNIISRDNSYHGSTFLTASVSKKSDDRQPEFHYTQDFIHHLSAPYPYRRPEGMSLEQFTDHLVQEFADKIAELGAEKISCFIAEPIQGSGGVVVPPPGYLPRMRDLCRQHGILFICDEVVTAFGRVGHWFASKDEFDIEPDIIVSAKGLTSGYVPLGVAIYSYEIHNVLNEENPDAWFTHGFTYSGHPIGCAVALANIDLIEREGLLQNAREVGDYFENLVRELNDLPLVGDIRGRRLMMGLEYVADKETKKLLPYEINISKRISSRCEEKGLLVRPIGHLDVMSPPLSLTRNEADFLVETLRGAIRETTDELAREGVI